MKLSVLGSGSSGNCVVFGSEKLGYWMMDAGLSAKQITQRLNSIGVAPERIKGIFITHEHKDHIGGLKVFLKKHPVPVYVSALTHEYLCNHLKLEAKWSVFEPGQVFTVGSFSVEAIRIPHDATDPVGYIFTHEYVKFAVMTDLGYVSESLAKRLEGVEMLYLESNYDVRLLELDTKRPWSIKQRISSRHGHLSNEQAIQLVTHLRSHGMHKLVFGHLSSDCNTPECIIQLMQEMPPGIEYEISSQAEPTQWLEVPEPIPTAPVKWEQPSLF